MSAELLTAAAMEKKTAAGATAKTEELRLFVRNLALLILFGVAISWWLLDFTDFFPKLGGFFGLAGIFAWIAFVSDLVTKTRKDQLQQELEKRVLVQPATTAAVVLAAIAFGLWVVLHGSLVVIAPGEGTKRVVEIRDGAEAIEIVEIAPGETAKVPLWTLRHRSLIVKTAGLPELVTVVSSAARTKIIIPQSFQAQPVVFALGLTGEDVASLGDRPSLRAQIRRGSGAWEPYGAIGPGSYAGESVWVGASADTELPPALRERQKLEKQPKAVGAGQPLRAGDQVRICVMNSEGGEVAFGEAEVLEGKQRPFPQELRLQPSADDKKRCSP